MKESSEKRIIKFSSNLDKLNSLFEYVGIICLSFMTLVVTIAIISRAFIGLSLSWVEESAMFCMAWIGAIGAGLMARKGGMTAIEIGIMYLPEKTQKIFKIAACCISYIFFVLVVVFGIKFAMISSSQMAITIPSMSMFWVYLAMPAGSLIMLVNTLAFMLDIILDK